MATALPRSPPPTSSLEATTIHDVLSNARRQALLSLLADDGASYTLAELAERIAEQEADTTPAPRDVRQSVYVSLQQTHVPKLLKLGIVEYAGDQRAVRLSDHADDVTVYLEVVSGYDIAWSEYYLGLGLLGLLTVVGNVVGVPVLSTLPVSALAGLFLGVVVLSATYHTWTLGTTVADRVRNR